MKCVSGTSAILHRSVVLVVLVYNWHKDDASIVLVVLLSYIVVSSFGF